MDDLHTRELEVLAESSRLLTATLDLAEVLDRLAGIARRRLEVDVVRIWLLDESGDFLSLRAEQGVVGAGSQGKRRLLRRESLSGWVLTHGTPLVLGDARTDARLENRTWFDAQGLVSVIAVPIALDQNPLGVLACMSRTPREFTHADLAVAQALTAPAVAAVRNAALYAEAVERVEEIQALQRVVSETLSSPALETALHAVVREMRTLLHCDAAVCSVLDSHSMRMRTLTMSGARTDGIPRYSPGGGQGGLASLVLREKRMMRSDDYLADPRFVRTPAIEAWARGEALVALIVAPVLDASREVIALLWAFNRTPTPFTTRHEATLSSLAQQASLAIGKARAFEEERRRAQQTTALLDIARACASTLELHPPLKDIARRTASALGAERCAIFLWRNGHLAPVMAQFADGHADPSLWTRFKELRDYPMEDVPAHAEAIRSRRPVHVTSDSPLLPSGWFDDNLRLGSAVVVPLISNDQVVGTMGLDARTTRAWHQSQVDLAMTIAAQVALAVDNARHYQDARQRAVEVETLAAIGETLTSTLDVKNVLDGIADSATTLIGAQRAVVFELDREAACLRARTIRGMDIEVGFTLPMGYGAAGLAAARLEPAWSEDVVQHPLPGYTVPYGRSDTLLGDLARTYGGRAILAVPVISRGTALGAISVGWDDPHRPDEREIRMLSALGRQAAIAIENARLVGDLRRPREELRAAQERAGQRSTTRAVGELAAAAAHQLNNIMAVILGRTQLLLMTNAEPGAVHSLKRIEQAAIDAGDTVRRIHGLSGSDKPGEVTRFDLNIVIQEVIDFTRPRWLDEEHERAARVEMYAELGLIPEVSGRRSEIREAIVNLVLNAIDALPGGGRIVITTRAEPGRAVVTVADSGIGMSPDVRQRAFEPFFTTKGVKRTGLGLAVAYGTVHRHSGQIAVESGLGQGTTVTFWIPTAEPARNVPDSTADAEAP